MISRRNFIQCGSFTGIGSMIPGFNQGGDSRQENRIKLFLVDPQIMLQLFHGPFECISIALDREQAPADAKVVAVDYDFARGCFRLLVTSKEFDIIPWGEAAPIAHGTISLSYVGVRRNKDGSYS